MVDYTFASSGTSTVTGFNVASDVLVIPSAIGSASGLTIVQAGSNVRISNGTATTILAGVTLESLSTANINLANGSKLFIGDGTTSTLLDSLGQAAATYVLGTGNDQVQGLGGNDSITTSDTVGGDLLLGNAGDDTISIAAAAAGAHTVYGGQGSDLITVAGAGANQIRGDLGTDAISLTGAGNNDINGNGGNDTITLNTSANGANTVRGGADSDTITITAATGINKIYGDNAADTISLAVGATGNNFVYGGAGDDSIASAGTGNNSIYGNEGADVISLTGAGANTIWGGQGGDAITLSTAAAGLNVIYGDLGNDTITQNTAAGATLSTLSGGAGDDVFRLNYGAGAAAHRTIIGDFAAGDIMQVTLSGGTTNALVVTGGGSSPVIANAANETISFSGYTGNFTATNLVFSDSTQLLTNFGSTAGSLTGGTGNDQLIAGSAGDVLNGGDGSDKLVGGSGNDIFNLVLVSDYDTDTTTGGAGTDTLRLTGTTAATLTLNNQTDVEKVEIATGTSATGVFTGTTTHSVDASATTVWGGTQTGIYMQGNDAVNTLTGSTAGNDTIIGGAGIDVIALGGAGNGADVVGFISSGDVSSNNTINNFDWAADRIGVASALTGTIGSAGALTATYYGEANIGATAGLDDGLITTAVNGLTNVATLRVLALVDNDGGAQAFTSTDIDLGLKNSTATGAGFIVALLDDAAATAGTLYYDPNFDNNGDIVLVGTITSVTTALTLANVSEADFYVLS